MAKTSIHRHLLPPLTAFILSTMDSLSREFKSTIITF